MNANEISEALIGITMKMEEHGIVLDICDGLYIDEVIYTFYY
jgi:hypothetical protein